MDYLCCGPGAGSARAMKNVEDSVVILDPDADEATAAKAMIAARASQPPDVSANAVYQDFLEHHDDAFVRIHIHLVGLVSEESAKHAALGKRRNRLGRPRVVDAVADPYVKVEVIREKEAGTDYFPIDSHTFPTIHDCRTPVWDSKCILLVKKSDLFEASGEGAGLRFTLVDENAKRQDEALFSVVVPSEELPAPTSVQESNWTHFYRTPDDDNDKRIKHTAMEFSLMITEGKDRMVSREDMTAIYQPETNDGYEYSQVVLTSEESSLQAVLECWKKEGNAQAVLWILGRNDCFMHPHVAKALFWSQGYDVYVLNYQMNGICRKHGFVDDPHFNSHNPSGNFNAYLPDIGQSLQIIESGDYEQVLGYAHSTGGPVLLNYLMEKGDDAFDGFLFNSPFLDWGHVGGDLVELVLENTGLLQMMAGMTGDSKVGVAATPEGTEPVMYLGKEIVLSDWSARLWSLYYFDWASRPLYKVPMTVGFAQGVTDVHRKMKADYHDKKRPITAKPFLCITSRGDDVLKAPETLGRADWIGPGRWEIELNDNGHDIFLSYDANDTDMAIQMCLTWMKNRKFA